MNSYHFLIHHENTQKPGVQAPSKSFGTATSTVADDAAAAIAFAKQHKNVVRVQSDKTGKYIYDAQPKAEVQAFAFSLDAEPAQTEPPKK